MEPHDRRRDDHGGGRTRERARVVSALAVPGDCEEDQTEGGEPEQHPDLLCEACVLRERMERVAPVPVLALERVQPVGIRAEAREAEHGPEAEHRPQPHGDDPESRRPSSRDCEPDRGRHQAAMATVTTNSVHGATANGTDANATSGG
jgi:hypothetical protein